MIPWIFSKLGHSFVQTDLPLNSKLLLYVYPQIGRIYNPISTKEYFIRKKYLVVTYISVFKLTQDLKSTSGLTRWGSNLHSCWSIFFLPNQMLLIVSHIGLNILLLVKGGLKTHRLRWAGCHCQSVLKHTGPNTPAVQKQWEIRAFSWGWKPDSYSGKKGWQEPKNCF